MNSITFTLGDFIVAVGAVITISAAVAAVVIFMFKTFITKEDAVKIEQAVDRILTGVLKPLHERLDRFEARMDKRLGMRKRKATR